LPYGLLEGVDIAPTDGSRERGPALARNNLPDDADIVFVRKHLPILHVDVLRGAADEGRRATK
jgi:hypothetical protein